MKRSVKKTSRKRKFGPFFSKKKTASVPYMVIGAPKLNNQDSHKINKLYGYNLQSVVGPPSWRKDANEIRHTLGEIDKSLNSAKMSMYLSERRRR